MFDKARMKLTLWYLAIILVISGTISTVFYLRVAQVLDLSFAQIGKRWHREMMGLDLPEDMLGRPQILPEDIAEAKRQIAFQLWAINGYIALVFVPAGYLLSGKTLRPIQEAMEEQKRFVGDAAHELRTPITALKTSLEVNLMDKKTATKTKEILKENLEDILGLEMLTDSLLKLAKLDGKEAKQEEVQIKELIERAVKQIQPLAKKKLMTIKVGGLPKKAVILGDQATILDLILIFLDNAIKYGRKKGKIDIGVKVTAKMIRITFADDGIGIAKHHIPHIFDRFYRIDSSRVKKGEGGYGLGLSLAKKIVDEYKGSVEVKSELNKGTEFVVKLPRA